MDIFIHNVYNYFCKQEEIQEALDEVCSLLPDTIKTEVRSNYQFHLPLSP